MIAIHSTRTGLAADGGGAPGASTGSLSLSDASSGGPRFRLTCRLNPDGTVAIAFDVAPQAATEFKSYVQGVGRRK